MRETLEREVKLRPPPGFRLPALGEALPRRRFASIYFDTRDHRLARAGVTLRCRVEGGEARWQLKLPQGTARREIEVPGEDSGPPPPELRALLVAFVRGRALHPVATLRTVRTGVQVHEGGQPVAEVVLDRVAAIDARQARRRFAELEVELRPGADEGALERIAERLREAGATDADGRPKLLQVLDLSPPTDPTGKPDAAATDPRVHLVGVLRRQAAAILTHDPGTRLGTEPEELHQMRVATRRLRAYLRAGRPLVAARWAESIRAELAWLGGALGPSRDLDVLIQDLSAQVETLESDERPALAPLLSALARERARTRSRLVATLRSRRYLALLDRLLGPVPTRRATVTLPALAAEGFVKLRKAVDLLGPDPSDLALHEVRIRGKRARYAAELAEAAVGKRASRYLTRAKTFQDILGDHQDAHVAEARLRTFVLGVRRVRDVRAAFATGRLVERQRARRVAARAAFPDAWRRLAKAGRKAWE